MILLACSDLKIGHNGRIVADKINFEVNAGEYVAIVGNNGSGKSTLIKTLLDLISPLGGHFKYDRSIKTTSIGYVPQQIVVKPDFPASVYEIILSGCLNRIGLRPFYTKKEKELVNKYIRILNIEKLRNKPFRELSGGEQQRVFIARALCSTDKILFLDEPFSGLDEHIELEMNELLNKINKESGVAIVLITHDVDTAIKYADKIIHMDHDKIFVGSAKEYLASGFHELKLGGHYHD